MLQTLRFQNIWISLYKPIIALSYCNGIKTKEFNEYILTISQWVFNKFSETCLIMYVSTFSVLEIEFQEMLVAGKSKLLLVNKRTW